MSDISNALPRGTILQGPKNRYTIQRALGQGSFGITYLATTEMQVSGEIGSFKTTVQVAVKEFFMRELNGREGTEVTSSSQGRLFTDYKKKFQREAVNLSKLQHPHIVKVLESFEANGTAYYAMEYIEGGCLDDYIQRGGGLPELEALRVTRQIGDALDFMHQHRMLHLDLKPGNVMLRSTGEVVLIDFGLSKQFDKNSEPESSTTIGGGTPGYAPIEQANYQRGDGLPVTMDVYALGATLYKMLTGTRVPEASEVLNEGLPLSELQVRGISATTIAAVERSMSPLRKNRFQDIRAFMAALDVSDSSQSGEPTVIIDAEPFEESAAESSSEPTRPLPKPINWKKVAYICSGVVGVALALILFIKILKPAPEDSKSSLTIVETEPSEVEQDDIHVKMIPVEGGTFMMGATKEQLNNAYDDEKPPHRVTLSSFHISETEVTQALWTEIMGSNPSEFKGDDLPVTNVSWDDCQEFIGKLNAQTGKNFRLPTEAEWEFAARGGTMSRGYKYSGSNDLNSVAWYNENSERKPNPVKQKEPNELGIYDMSGNVYEWCQDLYGEYGVYAQTNPRGTASGSKRVYHGGGWISYEGECRVSRRINFEPDYRANYLGFRLAL